MPAYRYRSEGYELLIRTDGQDIWVRNTEDLISTVERWHVGCDVERGFGESEGKVDVMNDGCAPQTDDLAGGDDDVQRQGTGRQTKTAR